MENDNSYKIIIELTEKDEMDDLRRNRSEETRKKVWKSLNEKLLELNKEAFYRDQQTNDELPSQKSYFNWDLQIDKV